MNSDPRDFTVCVQTMKANILTVIKAEIAAFREATGTIPAAIAIDMVDVSELGSAPGRVPGSVTIRFDF